MIFKWSIFLFRLWCQNKSYNNFKIFYKRLDLDFYIKFKSKFCRSVLWMLSISENKIYKRLCASGTPAGSVSWFIELCKDGGGDNRRFRISKKKKKKFGKGRGRSGSCSGLCRFTYFNGSSCTSGPRKVCLPFFHLIISSLLSILRPNAVVRRFFTTYNVNKCFENKCFVRFVERSSLKERSENIIIAMQRLIIMHDCII